MNIQMILIPIAILAGLGGFFGILLAVASRAFAVKTDERVPLVRDALPGANCGGCGYSGCDALAAAIVEGKAPITACGVLGAAAADEIAAVMGVAPVEIKPMRAFVACSGGENTTKRYAYQGPADCMAALRLGGGDKLCSYGCLGLGSCVAVCRFHALQLQNGVAVVDAERCTGCGTCVSACPKHLVSLLPKRQPLYAVACSSCDKGGAVVKSCKVGCIGCMQCQKVCEQGAVRVENNLAVIDAALCVGCGKCAEVCRRGCIIRV